MVIGRLDPADHAAGQASRQLGSQIRKLCRRLGLGLLAVHEPTARKPALVEPMLDPAPYQPRPRYWAALALVAGAMLMPNMP